MFSPYLSHNTRLVFYLEHIATNLRRAASAVNYPLSKSQHSKQIHILQTDELSHQLLHGTTKCSSLLATLCTSNRNLGSIFYSLPSQPPLATMSPQFEYNSTAPPVPPELNHAARVPDAPPATQPSFAQLAAQTRQTNLIGLQSSQYNIHRTLHWT